MLAALPRHPSERLDDPQPLLDMDLVPRILRPPFGARDVQVRHGGSLYPLRVRALLDCTQPPRRRTETTTADSRWYGERIGNSSFRRLALGVGVAPARGASRSLGAHRCRTICGPSTIRGTRSK